MNILNRKVLLTVIAGLLVLAALYSQWIVGQIRYHFLSTATSAQSINKKSNSKSNATPELNIPSIGVDAPVIIDRPSTLDAEVQQSLQKGVLLYGKSKPPGQNGHTVIIGHSSGRLLTQGEYKWVFMHLDKLKYGQTINIKYRGMSYKYIVRNSRVVKPNDTSVLKPTHEAKLSLITCTPVGTNNNRLVVEAFLSATEEA
jgi:LPXTG-site transpeptidase (sortase) family protein